MLGLQLPKTRLGLAQTHLRHTVVVGEEVIQAKREQMVVLAEEALKHFLLVQETHLPQHHHKETTVVDQFLALVLEMGEVVAAQMLQALLGQAHQMLSVVMGAQERHHLYQAPR